MFNYSMKFGVSEAAEFLKVSKETVKTWAYIFSDSLSPKANPGKGRVRQFLINDIRVFAYILMYWEENPDIDYIKDGLNSDEHHKRDEIDEFLKGITPLFMTMPEDIDETWGGVVFGGEFGIKDIFDTADAYKIAGDRLVEIADEHNEERDLFQPILYMYRHATELYLKTIVKGEGHDLPVLMQKFKQILKRDFNIDPPTWFENIIKAFDYLDPRSTIFRYGASSPKNEIYVDMEHVKTLMNWFSESFKRIQIESQKKIDVH